MLTERKPGRDSNYSVVCRLDVGDIEFLFTGDAETPVENILTELASRNSSRVGHMEALFHWYSLPVKSKTRGSCYLCWGWQYIHPPTETLTKLKSAGAKIYGTDLNGNIIIILMVSPTVKTAKNLPEPSQGRNHTFSTGYR